MAVAEHGGLAWGMEPVGVDERMPRCLDDFDVLHADVAQTVGYELGGPVDIAAMFRQSADAGNAEELLQLFEEAVLVGLYECVCRCGHRLKHYYTSGPFAAACQVP